MDSLLLYILGGLGAIVTQLEIKVTQLDIKITAKRVINIGFRMVGHWM